MALIDEITRRRTFAVIAHPDAGKTTLTEKLLLFGGAIHVAGAVKSNKIKKGATSDFMEIERQRGISVATSVMGFEYKGLKINILDTPGHEDFAEDTYRTLTAVDSVIIVIDGAKGVETQTRRLMDVCRMRKTPVIVFINKLDRPCKDPFDLLDEVERELCIKVRPLAFPISSGDTFKGVYNIYEHNLSLFTTDERQTADAETVDINDLASKDIDTYIGDKFAGQLRENIDLVEGVYDAFDRDAERRREVLLVADHDVHILGDFAVDLLGLGLSADGLPERSAIVEVARVAMLHSCITPFWVHSFGLLHIFFSHLVADFKQWKRSRIGCDHQVSDMICQSIDKKQ
mgnify:CR=1 FL=1